MEKLKVSKIFYSIQGEGRYMDKLEVLERYFNV
jgi:organic radical activating enzyme